MSPKSMSNQKKILQMLKGELGLLLILAVLCIVLYVTGHPIPATGILAVAVGVPLVVLYLGSFPLTFGCSAIC